MLPNARARKNTFKARLVSLDGKKAAMGNEQEMLAARKRVENATFKVGEIKNGEKKKPAETLNK